MTYKIDVMKIYSAYRNAGLYIKKTFQLSSMDKIVKKMEEKFDLKYIVDPHNYSAPHFLEFKTEKDAAMFILRWS